MLVYLGALTKLGWETFGRRFRRGQRPAPSSFVRASYGIFRPRWTMRVGLNIRTGQSTTIQRQSATMQDVRWWSKYDANPPVHRFSKELLGDWHGLYWQPGPKSCIMPVLLYPQ